MSKVVLVCPRDPVRVPEFEAKLRQVERLILPDDLTPNPVHIGIENGVVTALYNPASHLSRKGASLCLGMMINSADDWWQPGAPTPEGNYALYRVNAEYVEIVTDMLAGRTIWYTQTADLFIASCSQRAIVALLGNFELNEAAIPWMLSAGLLGADNSWDRRLRILPGDSRLQLDRRAWQSDLHVEPVNFVPAPLNDTTHTARMKATLQSVFEPICVDESKWAVTLSGGVDSRAVHLFLQQPLACVSYGASQLARDPVSDVALARAIAERRGVSCRFISSNLPNDLPMETVMSRYLALGEGRTDLISDYFDVVWSQLSAQGFEGIFRGDSNFGNRERCITPFEARLFVNLLMLDDFKSLQDHRAWQLPVQIIPAPLERRAGEAVNDWSQRLYQQFAHPVFMAALNDLKAGYIEVVNPLIFHSVIRQIRTLPASLRHEKRLLYTLTAEFGLSLPYAVRGLYSFWNVFFQMPSVARFLIDEINRINASALFEERLLNFLRERLSPALSQQLGTGNRSRRARFQSFMPWWLVSLYRNLRRRVSYPRLALRVSIVSRAIRMFTADAQSLNAFR